MSAAPPLARRIVCLSDVKVTLSLDGARCTGAQVRLTPVSALDLSGTCDTLRDNCSAEVFGRLETVLQVNANNLVKMCLFLAIIWWERNWTCDSDWELQDGRVAWDAAAVELLERLFLWDE